MQVLSPSFKSSLLSTSWVMVFFDDLFDIIFVYMFKLITSRSLLTTMVTARTFLKKNVSVFFKHSDPLLPRIPVEQSKIVSVDTLLNGS